MKTNQKITTASLMLSVALIFSANVGRAAPSDRSLTVGAQSPPTAAVGSLAYFPLSFTHTGTGSLAAHVTVAGLPHAATYSFLPVSQPVTNQSPKTKNAQLVISTRASTAPGAYPLTITLRHGNSGNVLSAEVTLVIGPASAAIVVPRLSVPVALPDQTVLLSGSGTANQPFLIQACNDLSTGIWVTIQAGMAGQDGLFSLIDQDSTNYPARFYRAAQ